MRFGLRELIFLLVLLAVPAASFVYVFRPWNRQIDDATTEVEMKQSRLDKLAEVASKIDDLGLAIERGRKSIELIEAKLPSQKDEDVILEQVWRLAEGNRLKVKSVKSEPQVPAAQYMELPLKMVMEGAFDGFYEFMLQLENLPRITRIHSMELARLEGSGSTGGVMPGAMRAEFTLSIYFEGSESN
ncbi:MAG: type IV pilus inner membrane component PilO [Planctomycetota bacterium]|jgi:type IV pilus assembly protein PilO